MQFTETPIVISYGDNIPDQSMVNQARINGAFVWQWRGYGGTL
jgi:hypothetical protein